jgi:hypothetical protein
MYKGTYSPRCRFSSSPGEHIPSANIGHLIPLLLILASYTMILIRSPFIVATLAIDVTMRRSMIMIQSRRWPRTAYTDEIGRSIGLRRRSVRWTTSIIASNHDNETESTQHYVFGYGSLMCPLSRQITNENLMSKFTIPILIHDLERRWCARTTTGYTAMGVQFTTKRFCTGILIGTINSVELEDLDRREASYHRLPV